MKYKNLEITSEIVKETDGSYTAFVKGFSGIRSKGSTVLEAKQKLEEALEMLQLSDFESETDWAAQISEEERKVIMQGISDFANGNVHCHEEALKIYGKYL